MPSTETAAPVARRVYTVAEVATMLNLNLGGTYALIREGVIPAMKLGGRWAIPRHRFDQWLDATGGEGISPTGQPHAA